MSLARLTRSWGRRGEIGAISLGSPLERFQHLERVTLSGAESQELGEFQIEQAWEHKGALVLKFAGVDSISDAEKLEGAEVLIPLAERPVLPAGEYYETDLIGCAVVEAESGKEYGLVEGFLDTGGPRLMELAGGMLIPYVPAICVAVDLPGRRIKVRLPEGLDEL